MVYKTPSQNVSTGSSMPKKTMPNESTPFDLATTAEMVRKADEAMQLLLKEEEKLKKEPDAGKKAKQTGRKKKKKGDQNILPGNTPEPHTPDPTPKKEPLTNTEETTNKNEIPIDQILQQGALSKKQKKNREGRH